MMWLLSNWKLVVLSLLIGYASLVTKLWRMSADDFSHYKADVAAEAAAKDQQHQKTVEDVSNAWNSILPGVRSNAVSSYLAAHRTGGGMQPASPGNVQPASGAEGTDGAGKEQLSACQPDARFIQDAAEDALKIKKWQDWATENQLPIQ